MKELISDLYNEVDCRIEHGAESGGHLEYVRERLKVIASLDKPEAAFTSLGYCPKCGGHKSEIPIHVFGCSLSNLGNEGKKPQAEAVHKADVCVNKDNHVNGALGDSRFLICDCFNAWILVEEKKPEKQTYKLSEMYKGWILSDPDGDLISYGTIFPDKESVLETYESVNLVAVTRADATEFYLGEGL